MKPRIPSFVLFAALACIVTSAMADGLQERVKQGRPLTAGLGYVAPAYAAGAKFRSPESIDAALAEDVAKRLSAQLAMVRAEPEQGERLLKSGKVDLLLAAIGEGDTLRASATTVPTGYSAGPMAIMRSDTDIKSWEQLKGRTVCLSEGGHYVGAIAAKYGAIEKVYKAPADSLLALRTGRCDAAVHDNVLLEELIKLPEWKKFSARLPTGSRKTLVFAVPAGDAQAQAFLKKTAAEWQADGYLDQLMKKAARHIAFEVYLDQDVPDCH